MMLVLSRKPGEEVIIGRDICITVVEIRGNQARLGITAPVETPIWRKELCNSSASPDEIHPSGTEGTTGTAPAEIGG